MSATPLRSGRQANSSLLPPSARPTPPCCRLPPGQLLLVAAFLGAKDLEVRGIVEGGLDAQHTPGGRVSFVISLQRVGLATVLDPHALHTGFDIGGDFTQKGGWNRARFCEGLAQKAQHIRAAERA